MWPRRWPGANSYPLTSGRPVAGGDLDVGLADLTAGLDPGDLVDLVASLPPTLLDAAVAALVTRHNGPGPADPLPHQQPPPGRWRGWLLTGGRGVGKTWAGSSFVVDSAHRRPGLRGRIIAPTSTDAIASCVLGESGILAIDPTATFYPSKPGGAVVEWPNGSQVWPIGTPTARDVDRLRALTNIDLDLFEEAAANPLLAAAVEQAAMSRRRAGARWVATTTPRPLPTIRDWIDDPQVHVTVAASHDNPHADPEWLADIDAAYRGTRLYRQEILGEVIDEVDGARWQYRWLDRSRVDRVPDGSRWAVGVDPASGSGTTGIVAVAVGPDGHLYVTDDASVTDASPSDWAARVGTLADLRSATIVAEDDQGGRMVKAVLDAAGITLPVKRATAKRIGGKAQRADAVAVLWEKDPPEGHVVDRLPALEDQLVTWTPDNTRSSPDRLDAMVWACTWLRTTVHGAVAATVPGGTFGGW